MQWEVSHSPVEYPDAVLRMEKRVQEIFDGSAAELVWLLEHPPVYTAGTSAKQSDLIDPMFPVYETGRGGQYTYHGPWQRVAYVMLDLRKRQRSPDIKAHVYNLEEWVIRALREFCINGERREGRVGIWVETGGREEKIAAIGVRVRRWVTFHGVAVNVDPDLSHYCGIVPCGLGGFGVTSMARLLGGKVAFSELDAALEGCWADVFESGRETV